MKLKLIILIFIILIQYSYCNNYTIIIKNKMEHHNVLLFNKSQYEITYRNTIYSDYVHNNIVNHVYTRDYKSWLINLHKHEQMINTQFDINIIFLNVLHNYTMKSLIQLYGENSKIYNLTKTIKPNLLCQHIFLQNSNSYKRFIFDDNPYISKTDFYFDKNELYNFIIYKDEMNAIISIKSILKNISIFSFVFEYKIGKLLQK